MFKKIQLKKPQEFILAQEIQKNFPGYKIRFKKQEDKFIFYLQDGVIYEVLKNFLKGKNINFEIKIE